MSYAYYIDSELMYAKLMQIGQALLIFAIGWFAADLLAKALNRILSGRYKNAILQAFLISVTRIAVRVLLLVTCLDMVGVPVSSLITALGALSLALGLAMQDSLSNLAQGVVILFANPFQLGDYVEIDSVGGVVEDMDLLRVTLRTPDKKLIYIANSQTAKARITNYNASRERRLELIYEVAATEDIDRVKEVIRRLVTDHPLVQVRPEPQVHLSVLNNATAQIKCKVWVGSKEYWDLYYALLERSRQVFAAEGIACPAGCQLMRLDDKPLPGS